MSTHFTVPISTGGQFVCTTPNNTDAKIYLLTFTSPPDNRLTSAFIEAYILSLDLIEHRLPKGVVVSTSGINKFFSNGLDLEHVTATEGFWEKALWPLFRRLLTYPMPTVALINGHAFAGGLMIAMCHDYRIQNPSKGFLCLNEVYLGIPLQPPMTAIFRAKVPFGITLRSLILEGRRFPSQEAVGVGLVDGLGGLDEVVQWVGERNLVAIAQSPSYQDLKTDLYREILRLLDDHHGNEEWGQKMVALNDKLVDEAQRRVEGFEKRTGKVKL